jgi:hypothetical protein
MMPRLPGGCGSEGAVGRQILHKTDLAFLPVETTRTLMRGIAHEPFDASPSRCPPTDGGYLTSEQLLEALA